MAAVNDYGAKICVKTIRFPVSEGAASETPFVFYRHQVIHFANIK